MIPTPFSLKATQPLRPEAIPWRNESNAFPIFQQLYASNKCLEIGSPIKLLSTPLSSGSVLPVHTRFALLFVAHDRDGTATSATLAMALRKEAGHDGS